MPQRIVCSRCKEVLYEGDLLKSPQDIIKKFDGRCPRCGKELSFEMNGVTIKPRDST